jgi:hypothetical protein
MARGTGLSVVLIIVLTACGASSARGQGGTLSEEEVLPTLDVSLAMATHWTAFAESQSVLVAKLPEVLPKGWKYDADLVALCQRGFVDAWSYTDGAQDVFVQNGRHLGDFEVMGAMLSVATAWRNAIAGFAVRHAIDRPILGGGISCTVDPTVWRRYYLRAADEAIDRALIVMHEGTWAGKGGVRLGVNDGSKFWWPVQPDFPFPEDFRWYPSAE